MNKFLGPRLALSGYIFAVGNTQIGCLFWYKSSLSRSLSEIFHLYKRRRNEGKRFGVYITGVNEESFREYFALLILLLLQFVN